MLRRNPVPQSSPRSKSATAEEIDGVRITHPDRVVFQDAGITKRDLAEYCVGVAEVDVAAPCPSAADLGPLSRGDGQALLLSKAAAARSAAEA